MAMKAIQLKKVFIITKFNSSKYGYYSNGYAITGKFMVLMGGDLPTFTHECGHILNLPHTFCCKESPVPLNCSSVLGNRCMDKHSTKNYMDYREYTNSPLRTHFDYYQWKTAYQASY